MPLYEYVCDQCQCEFELLVRADQAPRCPDCGATKLSRQLSVPAAPNVAKNSLPMSAPIPGTCGRPACGEGGCQGF